MPLSVEERMLEKLDQILRVLSLQVAADTSKSMTDRARLLKLAGLDNQSIADVLNTSVETVRTFTTHLRRKKR